MLNKMSNKIKGLDRNEGAAVELAAEFYDWKRGQTIKIPPEIYPYIVILWMLDRILAKED